jgi:opacity protein-like surface antigen
MVDTPCIASAANVIPLEGNTPQWRIVDRPWEEPVQGLVPVKSIADPLASVQSPQADQSPGSASSDIQPAQVKENKSPWIFGAGGGLRYGQYIKVGRIPHGMVYTRLGITIDPDVAISVRPAYVFGNVDFQGNRNNQGSFQLPVTIDMSPNGWLSPFAGAGIATNTDSLGNVNALFTAGLDIRLLKQLTLNLGANYIVQPVDSDERDIEAYTVLYFRF